MSKRINNFKMFLEGLRASDMSSIPSGYLSDVTARASQRMGLEGQSVGSAIGPLMSELGRSQQLSRGHEQELEELATQIITDLYRPLIEYYNIRLDIKFASGGEIRRLIDSGYARKKGNDPSEIANKTPVVKARGVDFSMLIHEAVKGMWRVFSMMSVPKDKDLAKAIESQFGLRDEPDDWKYGPEIAADLRDFINENPKVYQYDNVREEVWIYMSDEQNLSDDSFLNLMKGILSKSTEARKEIDRIIDKVVEGIKQRDQYLKDMQAYKLKMKQYERDLEEYNRKMESGKKVEPTAITKKQEEPFVIDYSSMTQRELNDELSKALDDRDYERAKMISQYIK